MLKKTITYEDFNGVKRTEDFFFNLNKAELLELQFGESGGLSNILERIVAENDSQKMMEMFKKVITMSYGQKSDDGKRFIKNQQVLEYFTSTNAFSDLFMEIATDADKAAEFIKAILPADISQAS
ncbi:MAG: hypothetical protein LBR74_00580 [Eubacterium sp.]|jgi:hypothetical protein|nr:hypothetical protein [Eubacterium sp.]